MKLSPQTLRSTRGLDRLGVIRYLRVEIGRMEKELQGSYAYAASGREHCMLTLGIADYSAEKMILQEELESVCSSKPDKIGA